MVVLAPRAGLPPAFLLSLGIHLVVIFGFLLSPAGDSAREVAHRAVTVLLAPSAEAPEIARAEAAAQQRGALTQTRPEASLVQSASPKTIEPVSASMTQSGLTMSATFNTTPPEAPVAARAALDPIIFSSGKTTSSVLATPTTEAWHYITVMAMCD